ncbi:hypothetical protein [Geodermatophilus maliterrae]|uniref:Antibiotic biosynthesis monooxygenase n=1 Tax=Geodermatophilus maliterrae TaxID=3162531 RepID=A0ABV3XFT8_9ACTN
MPLLAVHLRWEDVGPSAADRLRRLLAAGRGRAVGVCLAAETRSVGDDLYCTETWADDDAARVRLAELPALSAAAGLDAPTAVVVVWPAAGGDRAVPSAARPVRSAPRR